MAAFNLINQKKTLKIKVFVDLPIEKIAEFITFNKIR